MKAILSRIFEALKSVRKDDWMHFTVSLVMVFVLSVVVAAVIPDGLGYRVAAAVAALVATVALGVYKELSIDEVVSIADLRADVLGAVAGAIMSVL